MRYKVHTEFSDFFAHYGYLVEFPIDCGSDVIKIMDESCNLFEVEPEVRGGNVFSVVLLDDCGDALIKREFIYKGSRFDIECFAYQLLIFLRSFSVFMGIL